MKLVQALENIVGKAHVLLPAENDLTTYEQDWRRRVKGKSLAVIRPANTSEVAAVIKLCAAAKAAGEAVSVVPQGGNTGLVLGGVPDQTGTQIVLSLSRLNRVLNIDKANATMTVEAGCILQTLQQAAHEQQCLFPLSLAAQGSCQIGGNLATNAGGTQVLRYGNTRDLCLGLEVVTAQGDIWNGLTGLRKDNTGYDLRHLMIGSEGTLGIITAATLKLFPLPAASLTAWALVPNLDAAVALLSLAQQHLASHLTGFEVMGRFALSLVATHFPAQRIALWDEPFDPEQPGFFVLLENTDSESQAHARSRFESLMELALEAQIVSNVVIAENIAQAQALWHLRESIPLAQAEEGLNIKHDISVAVSSIAAFCKATDALLEQQIPGVRLVNFGHLGDGNLHYNVQCPVTGPFAADSAGFLKAFEKQVNQLVYDSVARFGGSISAEHGIGSLKRDELTHYKSPVALNMMRSIKVALDPQGLLNPGRVI